MARRHRRYKRRPTRAQADARTRRRLIRLGICLALLACASLLRMIFPSAFDAIGGKITERIDFKSAFSALGAGFSGDTDMKDAVSQAFSYATGRTPQTDADVQDGDTEDGTSQSEDGAKDGSADSTDVADTDEDSSESDEDGSSGGDTAAAVAAFKASQSEYSSYKLPDDVTYEYVDLGAECARPSDGEVTSSFGYRVHPVDGTIKFHYGVDYGAEIGDPVYAFADGIVKAVGESTTLGLYLILDHGSFQTTYAHLDSIAVQSGDEVARGGTIAAAGESGNATTPCLHFELQADGNYLNPEYYA